MPVPKRSSWTEAEVLSLPAGEHDYFDRKSASSFSVDRQAFLDMVAKALSAFANSGGGHLIIGLQDDAVTFDGVPLHEGRTPIREWFEQKIPNLLSYELQDFRVHEVVPDSPSAIPIGKVVLVIDVGDSSLAPHQTARTKTYYVRQGGHSVVAPHHYLELLRQRVVGPTLSARCEEVLIDKVYRDAADAILVRLKLRFCIQNDGRIAAYKWHLYEHDFQTSAALRREHFFFSSYDMPKDRAETFDITLPSIRPEPDQTILPGLARRATAVVGFYVRPEQALRTCIQPEAEKVVRTAITYRVATETYPGDDVVVTLSDHLDPDKLRADICGTLGIS